MMWLTENKEIIYKTFFFTGSLALFIGLGNYAYTYYKDNFNSITNKKEDKEDKEDTEDIKEDIKEDTNNV
jgi:hypothetical protein